MFSTILATWCACSVLLNRMKVACYNLEPIRPPWNAMDFTMHILWMNECPGISGYSNYDLAMNFQVDLGWYSRSRLCPGPGSLFQSTCLFSVKHQLQDWMNGPERLRVNQSKASFKRQQTKIWLLPTRKEGWAFDNRGIILTVETT